MAFRADLQTERARGKLDQPLQRRPHIRYGRELRVEHSARPRAAGGNRQRWLCPARWTDGDHIEQTHEPHLRRGPMFYRPASRTAVRPRLKIRRETLKGFLCESGRWLKA